MNQKLFRLIWVLMLVALPMMLTSCTSLNVLSSQPKSNCDKSADPSDADVKFALSYTGKLFQTPDWRRVYTVGDQRISITWKHQEVSALAYMEYLIWDCGYTQQDLDTYFSESNFKDVFFSAYQNPVKLKQCSAGNPLALYEYSASFEGENYLLHYWVNLDNSTRIMTFLLSFPEKDKALLDKTASQLFPKLIACP